MSDLPKTRVKDKTIKVSKITKMNCAELLTGTSRERDTHTERELVPHKEVCSFLIFQVLAVAP